MSKRRNNRTCTNRKPKQAIIAQQGATKSLTRSAGTGEKKRWHPGNTFAIAMKVASIFGNDGFSNRAAFLGNASPLMASGGFERSELTMDRETLTAAYRESWLAKRIIDMPAEDMTRAWYSLAVALPNDAMNDVYSLEALHNVKQEITNALRWARLYGGSIAVMALQGINDDLEQPLDTDLLLPGCFQGLLVLDPTQGIEPSLELVSDLEDPDYGLPEYYITNAEIDGQHETLKIHHSRVLRFIGRELPENEMQKLNFWGASELEHIWDELVQFHTASANAAQMLFQANITTLQSDDLMEKLCLGTTENREQVFETLHGENLFRNNFGMYLLGAGDKMQNLSYNFAGVPEIFDRLMMNMAGAAEIPETRLFGRSPQGMNSTGEADLQHYYDMIAQLQERMLRPALEKLLPILTISCWGFVPEDMKIVFNPIRTMSAETQMKLATEHADIVLKALEKGAITRDEARAELKAYSAKTDMFAKLA